MFKKYLIFEAVLEINSSKFTIPKNAVNML